MFPKMTEKGGSQHNKSLKTDPSISWRHDQLPEQTTSATAESEPEVNNFSSRLRQYPVGEFKIQEKETDTLGCGNFANVYKYFHDDLQMVAIKRFPLTGGAKTIAKNWEMVQREANILCRFNHRNIVKVFGITKWPNAVGIVMEYVDGGNLKELLLGNDGPDPPWSIRLEIGRSLVSALSYIHNYKYKTRFCHGDLKPENILLTKSLQVKLADFGSAAILRASGAPTTTLEFVSTTQHTLIYVAPEFLKDPDQDRDPSMDMYSLALVLYMLICKRVPFFGCAVPAVLPALIISGNKPNTELINKMEEQLQSASDRSVFNMLKSQMVRCWNDVPALRPNSKEVEMEMITFLNQQQVNSTTFALGAELHKRADASSKRWIVPRNDEESGKMLASTPIDAPQHVQSLSCKVTASIRSLSCFDEHRSSAPPTGGKSWSGDERRNFAPNENSSVASKKKTTLEEVFQTSDRSNLPEQVKEAPTLLEQYRVCLTTDKTEELKALSTKVIAIIETEIETTGYELRRFAHSLQKSERVQESIPMCVAAASLFNKGANGWETLVRMRWCVEGMHSANKKMIKNDVIGERAVKDHVIPLMRVIKDEMEKVATANEKKKCELVVDVLGWIGSNEASVGELGSAEKTHKERLARLKETFGNEAEKRWIYGDILESLGDLCQKISQPERATSCYEEAASVYKTATDVFSDSGRQSLIERCDRKLKGLR